MRCCKYTSCLLQSDPCCSRCITFVQGDGHQSRSADPWLQRAELHLELRRQTQQTGRCGETKWYVLPCPYGCCCVNLVCSLLTSASYTRVLISAGVSVFIDPKSLLYLVGSTMDYAETDTASEFTFTNPNAKSKCGCGESFNV